MKLKHDFPGSDQLPDNVSDPGANGSQAGQDLWVLQMLNGLIGGTYVEIGCNVPQYTNNTWILEMYHTWTGVSLDTLPHVVDHFNNVRNNPAVVADACYVDYNDLLNQAELPADIIDYLSVDCEPPATTLKALKQVLSTSGRRFRCITFEHDSYAAGTEIRDQSREYLQSQGYELVVSNVSVEGVHQSFEDWWADPQLVDAAILDKLKNADPEAVKNWRQAVFIN
jgi:hypothetical protein